MPPSRWGGPPWRWSAGRPGPGSAAALRLESHRPSAAIVSRLVQDHAVCMARLPAPLLVTEAETAADLRALPEISGTLAAAADLDLAVVSVASWAEGLSSVWEKCTPAQRQSGTDDGADAGGPGRPRHAARAAVAP